MQGGKSHRINSLILRTMKRVESVECDSPAAAAVAAPHPTIPA